ncbi:uncharacterized protein DS421_20g695020 [Arachis hypogaea]|nr:uncharacterized protein DS421_20g695020 [Arachis hypogaea]
MGKKGNRGARGGKIEREKKGRGKREDGGKWRTGRETEDEREEERGRNNAMELGAAAELLSQRRKGEANVTHGGKEGAAVEPRPFALFVYLRCWFAAAAIESDAAEEESFLFRRRRRRPWLLLFIWLELVTGGEKRLHHPLRFDIEPLFLTLVTRIDATATVSVALKSPLQLPVTLEVNQLFNDNRNDIRAKAEDGGFVPPAVRTVVLSRSRIGKDGGLIPLACSGQGWWFNSRLSMEPTDKDGGLIPLIRVGSGNIIDALAHGQ